MIVRSPEEVDKTLSELGLLNAHTAGSRPKEYPGDFVDNTGPLKGRYQTVDFEDPALLVCAYNKALRDGVDAAGNPASLHPWQSKLLVSLAAAKPTSVKPHKFCLVAANGSGKDLFIIAPFAIWFILTKIKSRVIVTSSSGTQLTGQTETYIRDLAQRINDEAGLGEIFRIRQRYIKCLLSGSEIRMFATDEAGKAEGYHPIEMGAEMAIIVNEGKSVTEEIHGALRRCTGYNYWLEVSTPGEPSGSFHYYATNWPNTKRITSYDCPHLTSDEIEADKREFGETSSLFRSKHLALFTSIGGQTIIPIELYNRVIAHPPGYHITGWEDSVGIDISLGGDETALCRTRGNRIIEEKQFRETDGTLVADKIEQILLNWSFTKKSEFMFADDGGIGHVVIDILRRRGWNIKRILNNWAAIDKKNFGNRGAENWYRCKRIVEDGSFDLNGLSKLTVEQLTQREYKKAALGARIYLQSKPEAKAHGQKSPDRADALILSLTGRTLEDYLKAKTVNKVDNVVYVTEHKKGKSYGNLEETERKYADEVTYRNYGNREKTVGNKRRIFSSLQSFLKRK